MKQLSWSLLAAIALACAACNSSSTPAESTTKPSNSTARTAPGDSAQMATQPANMADSADLLTPDSVALFNGRDLSGWTHVLADPTLKMADVWSVDDGVLRCTGKPAGYLRTVREDFENYKLTLEWRWPPGTAGGNNGVLVHASTPGALGIWPKSIEVQLKRDDAGDFWVIGTELDVENEDARKHDRRHVNLTDGSEKPLGEWNRIEITCQSDEVVVKVNDDLVNHATNCNVTKGAICLQSEGVPIEYRNIILTPLQ